MVERTAVDLARLAADRRWYRQTGFCGASSRPGNLCTCPASGDRTCGGHDLHAVAPVETLELFDDPGPKVRRARKAKRPGA